jgi:acetyl-CoA C-acetyltransferase
MTRQSVAEKLGMKVVARVVAHAAHAHEPACSPPPRSSPCQKVLKKAGWTVDDVDLFEINEAFAVVP